MLIEDAKVGMQVKVILSDNKSIQTGMTGVICNISSKYNSVGVSFDGFTLGHNCRGSLSAYGGWFSKSGWNFNPAHLEPVNIIDKYIRHSDTVYPKNNNRLTEIFKSEEMLSDRTSDEKQLNMARKILENYAVYEPTPPPKPRVDNNVTFDGYSVSGNLTTFFTSYMPPAVGNTDSNQIDSYTFRTSNLNIHKVSDDALTDGKNSFILIGKNNALVGVLQCEMKDRERLFDIESDGGDYFVDYRDGSFVSGSLYDIDGYNGLYYYSIISKDKISEAIKILSDIKDKEKIRKERMIDACKLKRDKSSKKSEIFKVITY